MRAPCKDCPDRHNLCHASCEQYLKFRAERDAMSAEKIKNIETYDANRQKKVWKPIVGNQ